MLRPAQPDGSSHLWSGAGRAAACLRSGREWSDPRACVGAPSPARRTFERACCGL